MTRRGVAKSGTPLAEEWMTVRDGAARKVYCFLLGSVMKAYRQAGPQEEMAYLVIAETENATLIGVERQTLELWLVSPAEQGKGASRRLPHYAIKQHGVHALAVYEQNSIAKGFYVRMGFRVEGRRERDALGNPALLWYTIRTKTQSGRGAFKNECGWAY